jgi:hypothetical protein
MIARVSGRAIPRAWAGSRPGTADLAATII